MTVMEFDHEAVLVLHRFMPVRMSVRLRAKAIRAKHAEQNPAI